MRTRQYTWKSIKRIKQTSCTNFNIHFFKITKIRRNTQRLKTCKRSASIKKGEKYEAVNYRPISLTCICCKIMEYIIFNQ